MRVSFNWYFLCHLTNCLDHVGKKVFHSQRCSQDNLLSLFIYFLYFKSVHLPLVVGFFQGFIPDLAFFTISFSEANLLLWILTFLTNNNRLIQLHPSDILKYIYWFIHYQLSVHLVPGNVLVTVSSHPWFVLMKSFIFLSSWTNEKLWRLLSLFRHQSFSQLVSLNTLFGRRI